MDKNIVKLERLKWLIKRLWSHMVVVSLLMLLFLLCLNLPSPSLFLPNVASVYATSQNEDIFSVYTNSSCVEKLTSLDWGNITYSGSEYEASKNFTVRNEGATNITNIYLFIQNVTPSWLTNYILVYSDIEDKKIQPNKNITATISLYLRKNMPSYTGFNFSFDIIIYTSKLPSISAVWNDLYHFNIDKKLRFENLPFVKYSSNNITNLIFDNQKLNVTVNAPSGNVSNTMVYTGEKGKPVKVLVKGVQKSEGDGWQYDSDTKVVTVSMLHASESTFSLDWNTFGGSSPTISHQLVVTVKDRGVPIDGANVSISNLYFGTTSNGRMSFSLPAGTYSITIKYNEITMNKTVELSGDMEVVFDVSEGVTVVPKVDLKGILQKYAGLIFAVLFIAVAFYYSRKPSGRVRRGRR